MAQTVIHIIWYLIPTFFFGMALWSWLEKVGGKKRQERPGDFLNQGLFVLACVLVSLVIDTYFLESIIPIIPYGQEFPINGYRFLLLPFVLLIAAKVIGPTKDIIISKPPTLGKKK